MRTFLAFLFCCMAVFFPAHGRDCQGGTCADSAGRMEALRFILDWLPSIPGLPDPLIRDEGRQDVPIVSRSQWGRQRDWLKKQLSHYITGTVPPPPDNLHARITGEKRKERSPSARSN